MSKLNQQVCKSKKVNHQIRFVPEIVTLKEIWINLMVSTEASWWNILNWRYTQLLVILFHLWNLNHCEMTLCHKILVKLHGVKQQNYSKRGEQNNRKLLENFSHDGINLINGHKQNGKKINTPRKSVNAVVESLLNITLMPPYGLIISVSRPRPPPASRASTRTLQHSAWIIQLIHANLKAFERTF